jgi:hypothetical protein
MSTATSVVASALPPGLRVTAEAVRAGCHGVASVGSGFPPRSSNCRLGRPATVQVCDELFVSHSEYSACPIAVLPGSCVKLPLISLPRQPPAAPTRPMADAASSSHSAAAHPTSKDSLDRVID